MSIATEITRLQTAKSNIKTAIENKGVTVPSVTTLSGYNDLIGQIENINKVSSVPSTKSSDIIYNTSDSSYYLWEPNYLCFTANTSNSTVALGKEGSPEWTGSYSIDKITWTTYIPGTTGVITLANIGDKVYFRGDSTADFSDSNYLQFSMTGSIAASGNIMSMCYSENFDSITIIPYEYMFFRLFYYCKVLTSAPILPATTLTYGCYRCLFQGCISLVEPPLLPAINLEPLCYHQMFYSCETLSTAPELPATTLKAQCYGQMFGNCYSITTAPHLPATSLPYGCYNNMFVGCKALTTPPLLPINTVTDGYCCIGMFWGCTALQVSDTQTAEASHAWTIPTTGTFVNTRKESDMFYNCAGTREIREGATTSDDMPGVAGQSYTYYTQNTPV